MKNHLSILADKLDTTYENGKAEILQIFCEILQVLLETRKLEENVIEAVRTKLGHHRTTTNDDVLYAFDREVANKVFSHIQHQEKNRIHHSELYNILQKVQKLKPLNIVLISYNSELGLDSRLNYIGEIYKEFSTRPFEYKTVLCCDFVYAWTYDTQLASQFKLILASVNALNRELYLASPRDLSDIWAYRPLNKMVLAMSVRPDASGAVFQLPFIYRLIAWSYLFIATTFALVVGFANLGNRSSIYLRIIDTIQALTTCLVSVFGIIKLTGEDKQVIRNALLGKRRILRSDDLARYLRLDSPSEIKAFAGILESSHNFIRKVRDSMLTTRRFDGGVLVYEIPNLHQMLKAGWIMRQNEFFDQRGRRFRVSERLNSFELRENYDEERSLRFRWRPTVFRSLTWNELVGRSY